MQFAAAGRIGLVDMIIPRLCLNSVALSGIRTTPSKNCSPGGKKTAGAAILHRLSLRFCTGHFGYGKHPGQLLPFVLPAKWGMQCTRPAGGKMLPQKICGANSERVACLPAHGDVSAKAGMRERAKDGFGGKTSGGGGKAERKIFSIMLARKVNRTETSLRNCAALSFICT